MATGAKISVKFFIDKDKNRVVFAEADKDFLDILFSFLTLPLSTVIELTGDSSVLESMANVYESVKSLDEKHLETKACKNMLLHPLSEGAFRCEDLKMNIGNTNPRRFYHCSNSNCTNREKILISLVPDVLCLYCGKTMDGTNSWQKRKEDSVCNEGGVFVKGRGRTFIITDDLCVMPASFASTSTLLQKLQDATDFLLLPRMKTLIIDEDGKVGDKTDGDGEENKDDKDDSDDNHVEVNIDTDNDEEIRDPSTIWCFSCVWENLHRKHEDYSKDPINFVLS